METVEANGLTLAVRRRGAGRPVLLLHGFPQTGAAWDRVAARLEAEVVVPDLPGYGASEGPAAGRDHAHHSKRATAETMVAMMAALGHSTFAVVGHDRGGRVAYRMALDHPAVVTACMVVEIVPTVAMWEAMDAKLALSAWHWPFLASAAPLPETLIGAAPDSFLEHVLAAWSGTGDLSPFTPDALAAYRAQMASAASRTAMCEDYRAGATCDPVHDAEDRAAGRRLPRLNVLHGDRGFPAKAGDVAARWTAFADDVRADCIPGGHFLPEEAPEAVAAAIAAMLA